jgi:hypothetical protein
MKRDTIIIVIAAALGVAAVAYFTRKKPTGTVTSGPLTPVGSVTQIQNTALPGEPGWGWSYFTDGTSIDPQGNYYQAGNLVYSAGG